MFHKKNKQHQIFKNLNLKIKYRESFRPFAPSILKEDVGSWFETEDESPYMFFVSDVKKDKIIINRDEIKEIGFDRLNQALSVVPAITHVDGTGRLQTVDKESNSLYYELISKFRSKTGIGMLLNTSFNENEPVVDTPQQAYDCFNRTDMDALCLGNYIMLKK